MARILLVHNRYASWVTNTSRLLGYQHIVTLLTCDEVSSENALRNNLRDIDLVVLDISRNDEDTKRILSVVREVKARYGPSPALVCVSWSGCDPRFQLELERLGARFANGR